MARHTSTKQRRAKARHGRRLHGATLNVYTAVWLTRRFMRIARNEAQRTVKGMRRSRSRRPGWRLG